MLLYLLLEYFLKCQQEKIILIVNLLSIEMEPITLKRRLK